MRGTFSGPLGETSETQSQGSTHLLGTNELPPSPFSSFRFSSSHPRLPGRGRASGPPRGGCRSVTVRLTRPGDAVTPFSLLTSLLWPCPTSSGLRFLRKLPRYDRRCGPASHADTQVDEKYHRGGRRDQQRRATKTQNQPTVFRFGSGCGGPTKNTQKIIQKTPWHRYPRQRPEDRRCFTSRCRHGLRTLQLPWSQLKTVGPWVAVTAPDSHHGFGGHGGGSCRSEPEGVVPGYGAHMVEAAESCDTCFFSPWVGEVLHIARFG